MLTGIQRSTTTALPGTVLKFTCECQGTVVLVFNDTFVANGNAVGDKTLADKNIFFERHESGSGSHNGYDIKIIASYENSGTYFMCIYQSGDCAASEHQISVIRGK